MNAKFQNEKFDVVERILSNTLECDRITFQINELYRKLSEKRTELSSLAQELDSLLVQEVDEEVVMAKHIQAYEEMAAEISSREIRSWDEFLGSLEIPNSH